MWHYPLLDCTAGLAKLFVSVLQYYTTYRAAADKHVRCEAHRRNAAHTVPSVGRSLDAAVRMTPPSERSVASSACRAHARRSGNQPTTSNELSPYTTGRSAHNMVLNHGAASPACHG